MRRALGAAGLGLALCLTAASFAAAPLYRPGVALILVAAAAVGLGTVSLWAAPTGIVVLPSAKPPTQLVQDNYDYYGSYTTGWGWRYGFNFTPACPAHYHYSCWLDPYGYRHCGCLINN